MKPMLILSFSIVCSVAYGQGAQQAYDDCIGALAQQREAAIKAVQDRYRNDDGHGALLGCKDCPQAGETEIAQIVRDYEIQSKLCLLDFNQAKQAEQEQQILADKRREIEQERELDYKLTQNRTEQKKVVNGPFTNEGEDVLIYHGPYKQFTIKLYKKSIEWSKNKLEACNCFTAFKGTLAEDYKYQPPGTPYFCIAKKGTEITFYNGNMFGGALESVVLRDDARLESCVECCLMNNTRDVVKTFPANTRVHFYPCFPGGETSNKVFTGAYIP